MSEILAIRFNIPPMPISGWSSLLSITRAWMGCEYARWPVTLQRSLISALVMPMGGLIKCGNGRPLSRITWEATALTDGFIPELIPWPMAGWSEHLIHGSTASMLESRTTFLFFVIQYGLTPGLWKIRAHPKTSTMEMEPRII